MNIQAKVRENPPCEVELSRKEIADLFGVSGETIKRRTAEGVLKPVAENSRVLRYGEKDIQNMVKMGYRLDGAAAQAYKIPAGVSPVIIPATAPDESGSLVSQDKEKIILQQLRDLAKDPAAKSIMRRFFATMILLDDLN